MSTRGQRFFNALRARGIDARQHFECCTTCGVAQLHYENDGQHRAYCFYNEQCTRDDNTLWLAFGNFDENDSFDIGKQICEIAKENRIEYTWNGSNDNKIELHLDYLSNCALKPECIEESDSECDE